jgi:hypothetical protein
VMVANLNNLDPVELVKALEVRRKEYL